MLQSTLVVQVRVDIMMVIGIRPVGSKFEMVRPYYSARNVTALKLLFRPFEVVAESSDSVAAVTLEKKALLHVRVLRCLRRRNGTRIRARSICERSFPKLTLRQPTKCAFLKPQTEILWMTAVIQGPF